MPFGLINFKTIKELKKLKENNCDVIVIQGWNYVSHWIVFLTSFFLKLPILLRVEMPLNHEVSKSRWKLLIKKAILKPLFKNISLFLSIGKQNAEFYKSYGIDENKILFSPYAVDNDFYRNSYLKLKDKKDELKLKYKVNKYKNIILFVGKFIDKKKPLDLIKAFHNLKKDDSCLLFVGEGNLRADMEKYIEKNKIQNIILTGFINQNELPNFYTIADLFVLPSGVGETWGLVINEAMNYDLPIIVSSTVGSCDDLVRDNGLTFKEGDTDDLSNKLNEILSKPNFKDIGSNSYNIIKNYSYENIENYIIEAINKIKK